MSAARGALAQAILATLRQHMKLSIGAVLVSRPGEGEAWRIDASDAGGERWAAEEDFYAATCMLAELVGFELEDG
jgi:hypothetical protein